MPPKKTIQSGIFGHLAKSEGLNQPKRGPGRPANPPGKSKAARVEKAAGGGSGATVAENNADGLKRGSEKGGQQQRYNFGANFPEVMEKASKDFPFLASCREGNRMDCFVFCKH